MKKFNELTAEDTRNNTKMVINAITKEIARREDDIIHNSSGIKADQYSSLSEAMMNLPVIGFRKESQHKAFVLAQSSDYK
jgi:hypothetical protein